MKYYILLFYIIVSIPVYCQNTINYNINIQGSIGNSSYTPLWFSSNRYGLISNEANSLLLQAKFTYHKEFNHNWSLNAGLDFTGGINQTSAFHLHQFYIDFGWKALNLSLGQKERTGFPLTKNERLSSGMLVEGANARPVPQIRAEIADFLNIPGTKG